MPLARGSHDKDVHGGRRAGGGSRELKEKPRPVLVTAAGRAPGGSGRGPRRTSICQGNPLPWVHREARLKHRWWGSTWRSQTKGRVERCQRQHHGESRREPEHAAGHQGPGAALSPPPASFSLGQESREEFRQKAKKKSCLV